MFGTKPHKKYCGGEEKMLDENKTKKQLISKLRKARKQITKLEKSKTEQIQVEKALQKSEKKYRELADSLPQVIFETDDKGSLTFANPYAFDLFGYTLSDFKKGLNSLQMLAPEERNRAKKNKEKVLSGKKLGGVEYTAQRKDGSTFPVIIHSNPIIRNNKPAGLRGIIIDITNRKKTEVALQHSRDYLDRILNSMYEGVMVVDRNYFIKTANACFIDTYGRKKEEIIGRKCYEVTHKTDKPCSSKKCTCPLHVVFESKKPIKLEHIHTNQAGRNIFVEISAFPLFGQNGNVEQVVELSLDITERKQADDALRESEDRYRMLVENQGEGVGIVDENETFIFSNLAANNIFGTRKGSLIGRNLKEFTDADTFKIIHAQTAKRKLGKKNKYEIEIIRKDKKQRFLLITATPKFNEEGDYVGAFAVFRDITERKVAEKALRVSEEKFRDLFENANDFIQSVDPKGRFLYVNQKWLDVLGYTKKEVEKLTLWDIIHKDQIQHCIEIFKKIKTGAEITQIETVFICKSGEEIYVEGNVNAHFRDGKFAATRGIFRDNTIRRYAEKALKRSLREKEVLLREIHHRVKNNLQVISSLINLQSKTIKNKKVLNILKNSQDRIKSMALVHERLYKSINLAHIDFGKYVKDITRHLFRTYGINPQILKITLNIEDILLDINTAIPCGLIINEIVSNSLKHAFPDGKKGEIFIQFHSGKHNMFILTVGDNGTGLQKDLDLSDPKTLGLELVNILVEQIKGTVEIDRSQGTTFRIEFKKPKYKVVD